MKKVLCLIGICLFTLSTSYSQDNKKQRGGRPSEQQEIKADTRLEKEIQQKQLLSKPELLETSLGKPVSKKANREKVNGKLKYCKKSCVKTS